MAKVRGELNRTAVPMASQQFGKKLLVNGNQALVEFVHLVFVVVDTQHAVADFSKACGRDQTNISRSDYGDCNGFAHLVFRTPPGIKYFDLTSHFGGKPYSNRARSMRSSVRGGAEPATDTP